MVINTDKYVCMKCSEKNWEPGTMNNYMKAINGIERTLYSKREVIWQIELFRGNHFLYSEWSEDNTKENHGLSDRYVKFLKRNDIDRQHYLSGYGFMQGYFNMDKVMKELTEKGTVQIPFEWLYDMRKFNKSMKGCYMEITRVD